MGRPKIANEAQVLDGAMDAFRRAGYSAVSIKDLERATGLKSGSIYHGYGDKDGIFRAAFAHYNDTVIRRRIGCYATESAGVEGLRQLFLSLLRAPESDSDGCLLTNAAVEFGAGDSIASEGVCEGFALLKVAFTKAIEHDWRVGKLKGGLEPDATAWKLLLLYQGLLVLIRSGQDTSDFVRLLNDEFNQLLESGYAD